MFMPPFGRFIAIHKKEHDKKKGAQPIQGGDCLLRKMNQKPKKWLYIFLACVQKECAI